MLINFLTKIREKDASYHGGGGPRHHHAGLTTFAQNVTNDLSNWIIWNGCRWGSVHHAFETVLSYLRHLGFCVVVFPQVFPVSVQLFVGPLGDTSICVLICECLPGIFFFIRCTSIPPFVLNNIGVFLNTCQKNLLFIRRIIFFFFLFFLFFFFFLFFIK